MDSSIRVFIKRLIAFGVTRFQALFKGSRSRSEVVATFLAVLEVAGHLQVHLLAPVHPVHVLVQDKGDWNILDLSLKEGALLGRSVFFVKLRQGHSPCYAFGEFPESVERT